MQFDGRLVVTARRFVCKRYPDMGAELANRKAAGHDYPHTLRT